MFSRILSNYPQLAICIIIHPSLLDIYTHWVERVIETGISLASNALFLIVVCQAILWGKPFLERLLVGKNKFCPDGPLGLNAGCSPFPGYPPFPGVSIKFEVGSSFVSQSNQLLESSVRRKKELCYLKALLTY